LGVLDHLVLSDAAWARMAPLIIGRPDQKGLTGRDNRMFVEGVLWIVRTGSPWRDLPEVFGDWNSVFRRFSRWSQKGVWRRIFEAMSDDPDFEYLIVDSTIIRAHQHAAGAKKGGLKIRPLAAASLPMLLLAPGRFATTMVWPSSRDKRAASTRPAMSVDPPGEKG